MDSMDVDQVCACKWFSMTSDGVNQGKGGEGKGVVSFKVRWSFVGLKEIVQ